MHEKPTMTSTHANRPQVMVTVRHHPRPEHRQHLLDAMSRINAASGEVPGLILAAAFEEEDEAILAVSLWSSVDAVQSGMEQLLTFAGRHRPCGMGDPAAGAEHAAVSPLRAGQRCHLQAPGALLTSKFTASGIAITFAKRRGRGATVQGSPRLAPSPGREPIR
jgi:hypothetical protein